MHDSYHALGSALNAVRLRLDTSTADVVNNRVPGYQTHVLMTESFETDLDRALGRDPSMVTTRAGTEFRQGTIVPVDQELAVGLEGLGFLTIKTPIGTLYTRNGDMEIGPDGTVQTRAGYPVLGEAGLLRVNTTGNPPLFQPDGRLVQDGVEIGKLKIVDFDRTEDLVRVGETLFQDPGTAGSQPAVGVRVHNQTLEMPKRGVMEGMVDMIAASRAFEAAQRVVRTINESFERITRQNG